MIIVVGILAQSQMVALFKLHGQPCEIRGRLKGGGAAGVIAEGWPSLTAGSEGLPALRCEWTAELRRYADIFALQPLQTPDGPVLGLADSPDESAANMTAQEGLAPAIAQWLLQLDPAIPAQTLRARLPQIALWVASRMRAQLERPELIGPEGSQWQLLSHHEAYGGFFSVEEARLRHRLYGGGWSDQLQRAVFVSGDAAVVLPWDPIRDRVLLIAQFRVAPALRGDPEPWLYEAVAGRVDATETPEQAARREAREEAGVMMGRLFQAPTHYPSPGAVAEMLYLYVGAADLPDGAAGVAGLESEDEDIASVLVSRAKLMAMIDDGHIRNGPLLVLGLWLDRHAARIRQELAGSGVKAGRA